MERAFLSKTGHTLLQKNFQVFPGFVPILAMDFQEFPACFWGGKAAEYDVQARMRR